MAGATKIIYSLHTSDECALYTWKQTQLIYRKASRRFRALRSFVYFLSFFPFSLSHYASIGLATFDRWMRNIGFEEELTISQNVFGWIPLLSFLHWPTIVRWTFGNFRRNNRKFDTTAPSLENFRLFQSIRWKFEESKAKQFHSLFTLPQVANDRIKIVSIEAWRLVVKSSTANRNVGKFQLDSVACQECHIWFKVYDWISWKTCHSQSTGCAKRIQTK